MEKSVEVIDFLGKLGLLGVRVRQINKEAEENLGKSLPKNPTDGI